MFLLVIWRCGDDAEEKENETGGPVVVKIGRT